MTVLVYLQNCGKYDLFFGILPNFICEPIRFIEWLILNWWWSCKKPQWLMIIYWLNEWNNSKHLLGFRWALMENLTNTQPICSICLLFYSLFHPFLFSGQMFLFSNASTSIKKYIQWPLLVCLFSLYIVWTLECYEQFIATE